MPGGEDGETAEGARPEDPVARFDTRLHRFFQFVFARFCRRHARALRVSRQGWPLVLPEGAPVVVFANHPSWWDGIAFMLLSTRALPSRRMFVPMDAEALGRYRFMARIGVFGVDQSSLRGALSFLRSAERVLADPGHALWINAPGQFQDSRARPVVIAAGVVRLAEIAPGAVFVPLALEYPFWSERKAEMLAGFGAPLRGADLAALPRPERARRMREALTATMDRLATDAISREPERFHTLLQGREGMGGFYDWWRRAVAALRGRRFDPRHAAE